MEVIGGHLSKMMTVTPCLNTRPLKPLVPLKGRYPLRLQLKARKGELASSLPYQSVVLASGYHIHHPCHTSTVRMIAYRTKSVTMHQRASSVSNGRRTIHAHSVIIRVRLLSGMTIESKETHVYTKREKQRGILQVYNR